MLGLHRISGRSRLECLRKTPSRLGVVGGVSLILKTRDPFGNSKQPLLGDYGVGCIKTNQRLKRRYETKRTSVIA